MASNYRDMKLTLLRLRNGNPTAYDQFLSLFNDLTLDAMKEMTDASTDRVLILQGAAQRMRHLMRMFTEGGYPPEPKKEVEELPIPQ